MEDSGISARSPKAPGLRLKMVEAGWTQRLEPGRQCDRSGCPKLHPGIGLRHRSKSRVQERMTVAMVMHTLTLRLLALTQQ